MKKFTEEENKKITRKAKKFVNGVLVFGAMILLFNLVTCGDDKAEAEFNNPPKVEKVTETETPKATETATPKITRQTITPEEAYSTAQDFVRSNLKIKEVAENAEFPDSFKFIQLNDTSIFLMSEVKRYDEFLEFTSVRWSLVLIYEPKTGKGFVEEFGLNRTIDPLFYYSAESVRRCSKCGGQQYEMRGRGWFEGKDFMNALNSNCECLKFNEADKSYKEFLKTN